MPNASLTPNLNITILNSLSTFTVQGEAAFPVLQGLMEGLGWRDMREGIFARDQEAALKFTRLQQAIADYSTKPTRVHQARLKDALEDELAAVQSECEYIQTKLYQCTKEAELAARVSSSQGLRQWILSSLKSFFGSAPKQQVERYTEILTKRHIYIDKLRSTLATLRESDRKKSADQFGSIRNGRRLLTRYQKQKIDDSATKTSAKKMELFVDEESTGFEFEFHVNNDYELGWDIYPSIAPLQDGGCAIVWLQTKDGQYYCEILGQRYDARGYKIGGEFQVNKPLYPPQSLSVTTLQDGGFLVVWNINNQTSVTSISFQKYSSDGNKTGTEFHLYIDNEISNPSIAALRDGGFVITWYRWRNYWGTFTGFGIFAQKFDSDANQVGVEIAVSSDNVSPLITALQDGGFMVVWQRSNHLSAILARRYDANGSSLGSVFQLTDYTPSYVRFLSLSAIPSGGFWISSENYNINTYNDMPNYDSPPVIYVQRYDDTGNTVGTRLRISNGYRYHPVISALQDGWFVITMRDSRYENILAQVYNASGNMTGTEIQVNNHTFALGTSIAVVRDGGFIIVWSNDDQVYYPWGGGPNYAGGIYGQKFDAQGKKTGRNIESQAKAPSSILSSTAKILIGIASMAACCCCVGFCICKNKDECEQQPVARRLATTTTSSYPAPKVAWQEEVQLSESTEKTGVFLVNDSQNNNYYSFRLELYKNGEQIYYIKFCDLEENGHVPTYNSNFYWNEIREELRKLPENDFEAAQQYYITKSHFLKETQELIDAKIKRYSEKLANERWEAERAYESKKSMWKDEIQKAKQKIDYRYSDSMSDDAYKDAQREIERLERECDRDLSSAADLLMALRK